MGHVMMVCGALDARSRSRGGAGVFIHSKSRRGVYQKSVLRRRRRAYQRSVSVSVSVSVCVCVWVGGCL